MFNCHALDLPSKERIMTKINSERTLILAFRSVRSVRIDRLIKYLTDTRDRQAEAASTSLVGPS